MKTTLTPHQLEIFKAVTSQLEEIVKTGMVWDNLVALSGAAGTGKTYLTTAIIEYLCKNYDITITAPTHKALRVVTHNMYMQGVTQVTAKTIHSFLNIKLFTDYDKGIQKFVPDKESKDQSKTDILIVDESSMVSDDMFGFIQDAIEAERVKAVLFVGDYYQLLPVDSGKNSVFKVRHQYGLKEIVRQAKDSYIIKIASAAREIIKSRNYKDLKIFFRENMDPRITFFHNQEDFLRDFYGKEGWRETDQVIASYRNSDVDAYNRLVRKEYWRQKGEEKVPTLREGDRIVFQRAYSVNNVLMYANNDVVTLASAVRKYAEKLGIEYWECRDANEKRTQQIIRIVDPASQSTFNDKLTLMAKAARKEQHYKTRKKMWETFFNIKDLFADVKYTFASTIHKLQGSTYDTVYVDLLTMADHKYMDPDQLYRLVYVAITRASREIKILIPSFESVTVESIEEDFSALFGNTDFGTTFKGI